MMAKVPVAGGYGALGASLGQEEALRDLAEASLKRDIGATEKIEQALSSAVGSMMETRERLYLIRDKLLGPSPVDHPSNTATDAGDSFVQRMESGFNVHSELAASIRQVLSELETL